MAEPRQPLPPAAVGASLVLPGLYRPAGPHVSEHDLHGARVWATATRGPDDLYLVPDLSRDIVLTDGAPVLLGRSNAAARVRLGAGPVAGVRLALAATDIRLDQTWDGWRSSRHAPEDTLVEALASGAIFWTDDALLSSAMASFATGDTVPEAAAHAFVSERTLRRRFTAATGTTLVHARRVLRLHRLAHRMRGAGTADSAARCGYADQSHAARDVRSLTGLTVTEFARLRVAE